MTTQTKPSNPKEAMGDAKAALMLVPATAIHEESMAFLEGALKYGMYNWRVAGVRASTYISAAKRHLNKYENGQDFDPVTLVKELASVRACCAILIDAAVCGMLNDDRPPKAPVGPQLDELTKTIAHLKELFKDHNPPQYTERQHGKSATEAAMQALWDACVGRPVHGLDAAVGLAMPNFVNPTMTAETMEEIDRARREAGVHGALQANLDTGTFFFMPGDLEGGVEPEEAPLADIRNADPPPVEAYQCYWCKSGTYKVHAAGCPATTAPTT